MGRSHQHGTKGTSTYPKWWVSDFNFPYRTSNEAIKVDCMTPIGCFGTAPVNFVAPLAGLIAHSFAARGYKIRVDIAPLHVFRLILVFVFTILNEVLCEETEPMEHFHGQLPGVDVVLG